MPDADAMDAPDPPGAASGSGASGEISDAPAADAKKSRGKRAWSMAETSNGLAALVTFVRTTLFGKKISEFAETAGAEGFFVIRAVHETLRGAASSMQTRAVGSNVAMQRLADEAAKNFDGGGDEGDGGDEGGEAGGSGLVLPVRPDKYSLTSNAEQRWADAKDILNVLWYDTFGNVLTKNGKLGFMCKQTGDVIRANAHMYPAWWDETVGVGVEYTRGNIYTHRDAIVAGLGDRAYEIKMRDYAKAMGGIEEIETMRVAGVLQKTIADLETSRKPWMMGLVDMLKSVAGVESADDGPDMAKALGIAGVAATKYAAMLDGESRAKYSEIEEKARLERINLSKQGAGIRVGAAEAKAIAARQALVRAQDERDRVEMILENAKAAAKVADANALLAPVAQQCKKSLLCTNRARHNGPCATWKLEDLLKI